MNDPPQDHIVPFRHRRPGPSVCGERPWYNRDPRTGVWRNTNTGNPLILIGDQWDLPAGDVCPNCLILTLTLGDDTSELSYWTHRHRETDRPVDIAQNAFREREIYEIDIHQATGTTPKSPDRQQARRRPNSQRRRNSR